MVQPEGMMMTCFNPAPKFGPKVHPRQEPKVTVPSYIGETGQVLNLLMYRGAGEVVRDHSGYGNHGTIYGPKWSDERSASWALGFDGEDDYVEIPDDPSLDITDEVTLSYWILMEDLPASDTICRASKGDHGDAYGTYTDADSEYIKFKVNFEDGTYIQPTTGSLNNNQWYFITSVYDGSEAKIYKNASLEGSASAANKTIITGTNPFKIGKFPTGTYMNGMKGVLFLYNYARSQSAIRETFEETKPLYIG